MCVIVQKNVLVLSVIAAMSATAPNAVNKFKAGQKTGFIYILLNAKTASVGSILS